MSSVLDPRPSTSGMSSAIHDPGFDQAPVAMALITLDGRWQRANCRLCRLLDIAPDMSGPFGDIIHPADRPEYDAVRHRLLADDVADHAVDGRILRGDGTSFQAELTMSGWRDEAGTLAGLIVAIREIDGRRDRETPLVPGRELLQSVIDHADMLIYVCDEEHRYVLVNRPYARILGTTPQAMFGRRRAEFMPEAVAATHEANESSVLAAGTALRFEDYHPEADGIHTYLTTKFPVRDASGRIVAVGGASTDVTEAAQQQAALRESEARFRAFFDNAMVGMATTSPDKGWTRVNPALCKILGYSPAELAGKTWAELTHPDDLQANLDDFDRMLRGESDSYSVEKRFIRKDGRIVHAFVAARAVRTADGRVDFFAATVKDISERRAAEQRLKEQHDFDRCLIENSPMGILTYRESGQCVLANEAAARITGGSVASLLQQDFRQIEAWRESGLYRAALDAFHANTCVRTTVHHVSTFGRDIWMECTLSIFTTRGERHLLLIVNDVSERMQAETRIKQTLTSLRDTNRKLEEAHNQLLQSEKLASIGQLAAGVAHELNNPIGFVHSNLGSLSSYVDDLLLIDAAYGDIEAAVRGAQPQLCARVRELKERCDHSFLIGDLRQLIGESLEGLDRVRKIVQDLKDFSRVGDTGWQWADLHKGLDSTLNIAWNEIKYKAEVDRQYGEVPEIRCIPSQLNQVFMNLLVNAAQAIEGRGRISIRTGCADAQVWIEIADTGRGIAPENLQRIFEPFFTTKPVGKGTGLGLSLSWGIVQRHKGTIAVRSESGQGTTFRITLPVDSEAADVPEQHDASRTT